MQCPLCRTHTNRWYFEDDKRSYKRCDCCNLVFVPAAYHVSSEREKAEYDLHQNNPQDPGYRRFLSRLMTPMAAKVPSPANGLDFGCGPGPTLSLMFAEAGYSMEIYDKFYANDQRVLCRRYDFITCTEVVEHLSHPGQTLAALYALLNAGGWLGIMTKLAQDQAAFAKWHYKNDVTHIAFFSRDTFSWLARHWGCYLEFVGKDVIFLQKPQG